MVGATRAGSLVGARFTKNTPSAKRSLSSAATWRPRRVLPTPPGPVRVTRRTSSRCTSRLMDSQAHVAFGGEVRLARVQPHADPHRLAFRPGMVSQNMLRGYRGGDSIGGTRESHEEGIALGVDLVAAKCVESGTQQAPAL